MVFQKKLIVWKYRKVEKDNIDGLNNDPYSNKNVLDQM